LLVLQIAASSPGNLYVPNEWFVPGRDKVPYKYRHL